MSSNTPLSAEDLILDMQQSIWLGTKDQLDDSLQTVAEKLLRSGKLPSRAYAMAMLRNAKIDHIRSENIRRNYESNFAQQSDIVDERSADFHAANREAISALQRAVNELSPLNQDVFFRAIVQGQHRAEIAADLRLSLSSIEKRLGRIRKHCMDRLKAHRSLD